MKTIFPLIPVLVCMPGYCGPGLAQTTTNPKINYPGFVRLSSELQPVRERNLVDETRFIEISTEPGVIILDARTKDKFENIHVKGAVYLALTDFTADALAKVIPEKTTRILIYCNNNFDGEPAHFAAKSAVVALNVQTFVNLHAYGYTNVTELGPLLDVRTTKIPFEGKSVKK